MIRNGFTKIYTDMPADMRGTERTPEAGRRRKTIVTDADLG
jgi:hypothetical protein